MATSVRPADVTRFTCGDCHIFAWALHRLTGLELHAFKWVDGAGCVQPDLHAFVVSSCGRWAADIEGWHEIDEFIERWGEGYYEETHPFTWRDFIKWWDENSHTLSGYSAKRARQLAPLIAKRMPPSVRRQPATI